ncbi:hypothetical protein D3C87_1058050 [compost metagenome]
MQQDRLRRGPGRPPKPQNEKRITVPISVEPSFDVWLREQKDLRGLSKGEVIERIINGLRRENPRYVEELLSKPNDE